MKRLLCLFVVALLFGCSNEPGLDAIPRGSTVLAFGDSVTFGTGAGPGEDWVTHLGAATGWNMINAGIPGDTAREARRRLGDLLTRHQPQLVIVELGGNDFLRQSQASRVKGYLREIVLESQATGAMTVIVAVPRLSLLRATAGALKDSDIYAELSEETGAPLIADVFSDVLSDSSLRADQVHPNAEGYRVMATGILEALQEMGLAQ